MPLYSEPSKTNNNSHKDQYRIGREFSHPILYLFRKKLEADYLFLPEETKVVGQTQGVIITPILAAFNHVVRAK
jgi:hypothetical protein